MRVGDLKEMSLLCPQTQFTGDVTQSIVIPVVVLISSSLLSNQDIVLLRCIFFPVRDLLALCLSLNREGVFLLVVQVFLDVEEGVIEDVRQLTLLQVP